MSDDRLLAELVDHVLEGQRDLHATCARIEERLDQALPAIVARQQRDEARVEGVDKRLAALEKRVLVMTATGSGVAIALSAIWQVLHG